MRCDPHLIRIAVCLATSGLFTSGLLLNGLLQTVLAQQYVPPERGLPDRLRDGGTRVGDLGRPSGVDAPTAPAPSADDASPVEPPGQYAPPPAGLPGRREAGGTRGGGGCIEGEQNLVALMPTDGYAQTISGYPTLFWYVPQTQAQAIEFVLFDEADNPIYHTTSLITGDSDIVSLTLPAHSGMPPLEVGELYRWGFSLVCDVSDRSADLYTEGWIQRVELAPTLSAAIEAAAVSDRPTLYAAAGIWHDALTPLAEQYRAAPENATAAASWRSLLESVGLEAVVDAPQDN